MLVLTSEDTGPEGRAIGGCSIVQRTRSLKTRP